MDTEQIEFIKDLIGHNKENYFAGIISKKEYEQNSIALNNELERLTKEQE